MNGEYVSIKLTNDPSLVYAINTFYTKVNDSDSDSEATYILSENAFDSEKNYYKLTEKTDDQFDPF